MKPLLFCILFATAANAEPMPPHLVYLFKHWLEADRYGNQIGYNFKQLAVATSEFGEFKMPCGRDAFKYTGSRLRPFIVSDPNTVMVECAELRKFWDSEKFLEWSSGDLYIPPNLMDANQVAVDWVNKSLDN